jgi:ELWxxDGT repeat protein
MANLATAMGKLYYSYDDGSDTELWEFDPNNGANGTAQQVADINVGGSSNPNTLIEYQGDNGALYFKANDGTNEVVHKYDGNSVTAISSLNSGSYSKNLFRGPTEFNGKLYFINTATHVAYPNSLHALTEWDGSNVTVIAGNTTASGPNDSDWVLAPGTGGYGSADGQKLYVSAYRRANFNGDQVGQELFYWDVNSGTQNLTLAASFNLTSSDYATSHGYPAVDFMIEYDGSLFTRANSSGLALGVTNGELWELDPTDYSKTEYEIGSATNHNGLEVAPMIVFKDKLYMIGDDDQANTGKELFVFDRSGIPELVMDINLGPGDGFNNAEDPTDKVREWWDPTIFNDKLYFIANDGTGSDLWVYDGISDPTKAYDFATTSIQHLTSLTILDDTLFFLGDSGGASSATNIIDLWSIG